VKCIEERETYLCIPSLLKGKVPSPFAFSLEDEFSMRSDLGKAFLLLHGVVGLSAFSKLKVLHLTNIIFPERDLSWTAFFLQAPPLLEIFKTST
jgi:hypothetical protein